MKDKKGKTKRFFACKKSFTMVELLISVGIVIVMAGVAFIGFGNYKNRHSFDLDVENIVEAIRNTQNRSINQEGGYGWSIKFTNSTSSIDYYQIFSGTSYATSSVVVESGLNPVTDLVSPVDGSSKTISFIAISGKPILSDSLVVRMKGGSNTAVVSISSQGKIGVSQDDSLVGYWPFDGGTSGIIADDTTVGLEDVSGNSNNGTANNGGGTTWAFGKLGGAISFNGASDYIDIGNKNIVDGLNKVTWSIWFSEPVINPSGVLWSSWSSSGNSQIILRKSNSASTDFYCFVADSVSDAGNNYGLTNTAGYSAGSWNNIVIVFDGTQIGNANKLKAYINGQDIGFSGFNGGIPASLTLPTTKYWAFGNWFIVGGYNFKGLIDDVRIYNRALSPTEVKNLYDSY
ncbi:MAG: LamG-like jellyroll fold domain-containing protein [Candidatus Paceibacterota bacterium]|jgi:type II secretory pathway pseudopilin PulG